MAQLVDQIRLATFNLGFAGLGVDSDFFADGGKRRFAPSRASVARNMSGILSALDDLDADVFLLQEVTRTSPLNYWMSMEQRLREHLPDWHWAWRDDIVSRFLPWLLRIDHGAMAASRRKPDNVDLIELYCPPEPFMRFLQRAYGMQVLRYSRDDGHGQGRGDWVVAHVHLSAFDDGGKTRLRQLQQVREFAQREYERGHHVIVGGDWNMVLHDPGWRHQTDLKNLSWIVPFPKGELDPGWQVVADETMPSVRTLYQPYVAGENYVTTIDGFIVSPNVVVEEIATLDTGFVCSDHMPVSATFRAA